MNQLRYIPLLFFLFALNTQPVFSQQEGFGIGAIINGPTGVSYKAWLNNDLAIAGALTFNLGDFSTFYTHADLVKHANEDGGRFDLDSGLMRLYYGGGLLLTFNDATDDTNLGLRIPGGAVYIFEEAPVDIFVELAPTLTFDNTNFGFTGALGIRFYPSQAN